MIVLGIAIAVHCDGRIAFHVHDNNTNRHKQFLSETLLMVIGIDAGASRQETMEAIGVAILMGADRAWSTAVKRWKP